MKQFLLQTKHTYSYDHMDLGTIQQLDKLHPDCKFYVPLGNKKWFKLSNKLDSQGNERVIELDWWDSINLQKTAQKTELRFTCTPCQHQSGRTPFDLDKTLWASWCVEGLDETGNATKGKVFFGGYVYNFTCMVNNNNNCNNNAIFISDTGYRTIPAGTKPELQHDYGFLDSLPHCPAFKGLVMDYII
jgi:N-acyl-phosphatidylethanolamine-hydrolysing phospholipase D